MKVLITRPRSQAAPFAEALRAAGFEPAFLPVIEVRPVDDLGELEQAIGSLSSYDWIVFTSINAVEIFFDRVGDWNGLKQKPKIAVIGSKTAAAVKARGAEPDFVPEKYVAESILPGLGNLRGKRILLPAAEIGRDVLVVAIAQAGGTAHELSVYRTLPTEPDADGLTALRAGVDVVTFTSPSTVDNFVLLAERYGLDPLNLPGRPRIACIGPITEEAARQRGFTQLIVASDHTSDGIIEVLKQHSTQLEVR